MGTKFANLQVYNLQVSEIETLLPGCIAKRFSNKWTTIVRDDFQIGLIEQEARILSKKIDKAVLSVGYYDDDVLALNIFRNGRSVACHISDNAYGYVKKTSNPITFAHELELDETDTECLKWIFKCENLPKKVQLLEMLLG